MLRDLLGVPGIIEFLVFYEVDSRSRYRGPKVRVVQLRRSMVNGGSENSPVWVDVVLVRQARPFDF